MNRIAGIFNLDHQPVRLCEVNRMVEVMKAGPLDQQNIRLEEEVGFGCIHVGEPSGDPANGLQLSNKACLITFDGRIDNRPELLAILRSQLAGGPSSVPDERIILAAYEKWGRDCAQHLIGDFAFAIWDRRNQRLICVRDHFGVKPFYYSFAGDSFVFASAPHALLASGKVPARIHEERIADLLMEFAGGGLEAVDKTSSFYKDVFRLPPGHTLIVQPDGMILERYWELCPAVRPELKTEQEYLEAFQELFTESVRCRLQNVTPASMLSGGMDSSAIVGMSRRILREAGRDSLRAFAVISISADKNRETSHIRSVINQGNLQSHLISEAELSQEMDRLVQAIEAEAEPFDCLMNLNRAVYLQARDQGLNALLDGVDGDLLLSDSFCIPALLRQGAFRTVLEETFLAGGLVSEYKLGRSLFLDGLLSVFTPLAPDFVRQRYRQRRFGMVTTSAVEESIVEPKFAAHSQLVERIASLHSYRDLPASRTQMDAHKVNLEHPNLPAGLERYERVASAFGIEARHPFADVRLTEFCLSLPWHLKSRHGWTKLILRRAMQPYLPAEVIWRRDKDSLMWEVNRRVLKERTEYFYQVTRDEQDELMPYVDLQKLGQCWHEYLTLGDETHAELIWSGIALALWLRRQRQMKSALPLCDRDEKG